MYKYILVDVVVVMVCSKRSLIDLYTVYFVGILIFDRDYLLERCLIVQLKYVSY